MTGVGEDDCVFTSSCSRLAPIVRPSAFNLRRALPMLRSVTLLAVLGAAGATASGGLSKYKIGEAVDSTSLSASPGSSSATRPMIEIVGPNPLRIDVDPNKLYYEDEGAACTDPVEGNLNMDVVVSGDFVEIGRPGLYHLMYECSNSKGVAAKPAIRTIVVSENFDPGCTTIIVAGRTQSMSHYDTMGSYELQFTRCERGPGEQGINERPDGRCVQTTVDGSPIFRQQNGANFMYYYKPHGTWFIDTDFDCTTHCTPTGNPNGHKGLRAPDMAHQPENVAAPWQIAKKDGSWGETSSISVGCTAPPPLPDNYDFKVDADVRIVGFTPKTFDSKAKSKFLVAISDALDVAQADIVIMEVTKWVQKDALHLGNSGAVRRLRAATHSAISASVDVKFEVTNTQAKLQADVVPQLKETMFSQILASELVSAGLPVRDVYVEHGTVTPPSMTTKAKIKLVAIWVGGGAALVLLVTSAFLTQKYYQKRATTIMLEDEDVFVTEETSQLTFSQNPGGAAASAAYDTNADDGDDGPNDTL